MNETKGRKPRHRETERERQTQRATERETERDRERQLFRARADGYGACHSAGIRPGRQ